MFFGFNAFATLPPIPKGLLVEQLRHAVRDYLVEDGVVTEEFSGKLLPEGIPALTPHPSATC